MRCIRRVVAGVILIVVGAGAIAAGKVEIPWSRDPRWHDGKAEWALYEATRQIYGKPRTYEATIFTNKELYDPVTTTKSNRPGRQEVVEVFKHTLSELIPTENYTYRFLTTSLVEVDTLRQRKLTMSSQEDCGATYKQIVLEADKARAISMCYFPETGDEAATFPVDTATRFHDSLSLVLRDYPFESGSEQRIRLVSDQTDTRPTPMAPGEATVRLIGSETIDVPYGRLPTYHLQVEHEPTGGTTTSDFWFARDRALRHVLVQYRGPWGVEYRLKRLDWWAYWAEPKP